MNYKTNEHVVEFSAETNSIVSENKNEIGVVANSCYYLRGHVQHCRNEKTRLDAVRAWSFERRILNLKRAARRIISLLKPFNNNSDKSNLNKLVQYTCTNKSFMKNNKSQTIF